MKLDALYRPRTVAVVGASDRPGSFGCNAALHAAASRVEQVWFVNPKKQELLGRPAYPALSALPEVPECVLICTPQKAVPGVMREAASLGVRAAVIYASGFSEEQTPEGRAAEQEILSIARAADMAVLGPNCAGLLNATDRVNLWGMGCELDWETCRPGVGVLAQSGFIAQSIMGRAGMQLSCVVSSGNGRLVRLEDHLAHMVADPSVRVIALYLEGVQDAASFTDSLRLAAELSKPVVVLKAGKSSIGAKAAASHTGNLAGSTQAYSAIFRKYGVLEVDCLEELLCLSQMFSVLSDRLPARSDRRFGVYGLNSSGGANTICADLCEKNDIYMPPLSDAAKTAIRGFLPGFASVSNPQDATTSIFGDVENTCGILTAVEAEDAVDFVTVGNSIDQKEGRVSVGICEALLEARRRGLRKPYLMVPSVECTPSLKYKRLLEENGIVLASSALTAYRCLGLLLEFLHYDPAAHDLSGGGVRAVGRASGLKHTRTEFVAKNRLRAAGMPVAAACLCRTEAELLEHTAQLAWPVAMKISSEDIAHKTECGGVRLNIGNPEQAVEAFREILENCRSARPEAVLEGVLVEPMARPGAEIILGVQNDPQFGQLLLAGLGGIYTELFRDYVLVPCPVNRVEAMNLLRQLRAWPLLNGFRGAAPKDVEALADLMVRVSQYAAAHPELQELDLNPVFVFEKGAGVQIADALMAETEDASGTGKE